MRILITAGPTREYLDDVRYLSNASTGRMGYALAQAAREAGHHVTLVHGPTAHEPPQVDKLLPVTSALEMFKAVAAEFPGCEAFIACAAVSDFRPTHRSPRKIKREQVQTLTLELVANPDIVREMAARRRPGQVVIAFALETDNAEANARAKLARKGADAIVLNLADAIGAADTHVTMIRAAGGAAETFSGSKADAARRIVALAEALLAPGTG